MNGTVSREQLLRKLQRSQFPLDWRVAADLLEEAGDPAARIWRRRGTWWPALLEALFCCVKAKPSHRNKPHFWALAGRWRVTFTRNPKSILVRVVQYPSAEEALNFPDSPASRPLLRRRHHADEAPGGSPFRGYWMLAAPGSTEQSRGDCLRKNLRNLIDMLGEEDDNE